MNQDKIRFIVERRCKSESKHGVLLGAVPVSSKDPAEDVQRLIRSVDQCRGCTFHSKFYLDKYSDLLELNNIEKVAQTLDAILLKWMMLILTAVMVFLTPYSLFNYGFTHTLSVLLMSVLFFFTCTTIDTWKNDSLSKRQKMIVLISLLLFFYSIFMLPTKEAIEVLNDSGVNQTFLDVLKSTIN
ncbi:hypothetical protein [Pseudomonas anguilliseptica]|uniref:hypothetical protein n=1 Tax=Pseudomonas anguilliseptica TaxID=53406 RepID=UPI003736C8B8